MRDAIKIFRKFLPPYKTSIILNVIFNFLAAIFGIFSFFIMTPLLKILLQNDKKVYAMHPIDISFFPPHFPKEPIMNNIYALTQGFAEKHGALTTLIWISVVFLILVLLKTGFTYLASLTMVVIRNGVVRDIRNKLYKKIVHLPIGFFSEEHKGDIMARVTGDVAEIENSIMTSLDMFFKNPIIIFITIVAMIFMSWQLTLFVFVFFPIAGGIVGLIGKKLKKASMRGQNKMGEILSTLEETLGGLRIIKAFNAEDLMKARQIKQNEEYRDIMNKVMGRNQLASPVSEFLGTIIIVIVMIFGGNLILGNRSSLDSEEFIVYLVFFYNIINPTKAFSSAFYNIQKGLASMDRIDMILSAENKITNVNNPLDLKSFEKSIEYRDVCFRYGEEYVLNNINLKIPKGKTIALVGQSGSGKSTMVDLLPRFWDIHQGNVLIDGKDVRQVRVKELRDLFGIVNQEPILFNDTIFNNIAFGSKSVTEEQVIHAAKIANAHDFITATENGYQTNIGDRGGKLSGGQRQRISIARAILKNPPILILDEATSSLDTESEKLVQDAIYNLMKDRTSIVIAHRLSTIRNVDDIYVLRDGEIIEKGNYESLLKLNGEFKKLHDHQFS
jgi:ATP-binding cassette, subfamily B, bacterial MsbA